MIPQRAYVDLPTQIVSTSRRILKLLDRPRQSKRIRRYDRDIGIHRHERALVEMLWVDNRAVDVGKNLEFVGHAQVVSVTRYAVGNHSLAHLLFRVRINHVVLLRHAPDPTVTLDHETPWELVI